MKKLVFAAFVLLILSACAPKAIPTPELAPADNYTDGLVEISDGWILFIRLASEQSCLGNCGMYCPAIEPPMTAYSYSKQNGLTIQTRDLGWLPGDRPLPVGLYGSGRFNENLQVIRSLPFDIPEVEIRIRSVDSNGRLVVLNTEGKAYFLEAGQSIKSEYSLSPQAGCQIKSTYTFVNQGLLSEMDIHR